MSPLTAGRMVRVWLCTVPAACVDDSTVGSTEITTSPLTGSTASVTGISISPLANPAMPMPMPMPVLVSALPGMQAMATSMMKAKMKKKGVASLEELRAVCQEADVKFIACQMTVDLFDFSRSDFIDGIEYGGAATFMKFAGETDVCLFI